MAKLTLSDISSGYVPITTINANWALIETALENTLSRDGTSPNTMLADLDMNSKNILNLASLDVDSLSINGTAVIPTGVVAAEIPTQTGQSGKYLKTNGTAVSWQVSEVTVVSTIAAMKALAVPTTDLTVMVRGYYASADGGGGTYYWNSGDTTTGNDATIVVCTANGAAAGRFNLLF